MKLIYPTALVIVVVILGAVWLSPKEVIAPTGEGTIIEETTGEMTEEGDTYTLAEVREHASEADCWTAIRGIVYDLTAWIAEHPGGKDAILGLCGTDGTAAFEEKHGGSEKQEMTLKTFSIGTLAP